MKANIAAFGLIVLIAVGVVSTAVILLPKQKDNIVVYSPEVKKFSSLEELRNYIKSAEGVSPWYGMTKGGMMEDVAAPNAPARSDDYSTTNIQVAGVDEADIVKNDGKYIYTVSGSKVIIIDAYPAEEAKIRSEIDLKNPVQNIYINKDRLIVIGNVQEKYPEGIYREKMMIYPYFPQSKIFVSVYDITDRENPKEVRSITLEGWYANSRMIGDYVYLIATAPIYQENITIPQIQDAGRGVAAADIYYFDGPIYSHQFTTIMAFNVQSDEDVSSKIYLGDASETIYVSQENLYITHMKRFDPFVYQDKIIEATILPYAPEAGEFQNEKGYEKYQKIYEAFSEYFNSLSREEQERVQNEIIQKTQEITAEMSKEFEKTVIHRISLKGKEIAFEANGEVPGRVLNQFSMDEYQGNFRIAITLSPEGGFFGWGAVMMTNIAESVAAPPSDVKDAPVQPTVDPDAVIPGNLAPSIRQPEIPQQKNNVYVLDMNLKIVGSLEDLAPGESIYSARFLGNRVYLVTFRKVDPLFVIDLSSPSSPKVLGKLKIPGYSEYLHPYDETHIIGIGKEATEAKEGDFAWYQGVKLSFFDVSDVESPKEISKFNIGDRGTDSEALRDHKAFLFNKEKNLLVIPILLAEIDESQYYPKELPEWAYGDFVWQGAYVLNIDLQNGFSLRGKITHIQDDSFDKSGYYYFSPSAVKRSLYIGNALYTLSDKMVKANDLQTLEEIKTISLPYQEQEFYPRPL